MYCERLYCLINTHVSVSYTHLHTGLTAIVAGFLFLISTLFAPLFTAIPSFATAPALIMVGFLMFGAISDIKFTDDNMTEAVPAYLCIIAMPLFYSCLLYTSTDVTSSEVKTALLTCVLQHQGHKLLLHLLRLHSPVIHPFLHMGLLLLNLTATILDFWLPLNKMELQMCIRDSVSTSSIDL